MSVRQTRLSHLGIGLIAAVLFAVACGGGDEPLPTLEPGSGALFELDLSSPDFGNLENIPEKFTCDGADQSPRLEWGPVPQGTAALTIIVDDPDAPGGIFNHWVVYDMPVELTGLTADQPRGEELPVGGTQGTNDAGVTGWSGPCPPPGPAHQYDFFLYALESTLELEPGASRNDVARALRDAGVIGVGVHSGLYARQ